MLIEMILGACVVGLVMGFSAGRRCERHAGADQILSVDSEINGPPPVDPLSYRTDWPC